MHSFICRIGLLLGLFFLLGASTPASAAWITTNFQVYGGMAVDAPDWLTREGEAVQPEEWKPMFVEIEAGLREIAKEYQLMKFTDPVAAGAIDSLVQDADGNKFIRVYLANNANYPYGWYSRGKPCSDPPTSRKVFTLNISKSLKDLKFTDIGFQTAAHELFHAIQYASPAFEITDCGSSTWITEGTADAIAFYLSRKLRNLKFKDDLKTREILKVVGGRRYDMPLNKPKKWHPYDETDAYLSSSFWRHLAEIYFLKTRRGQTSRIHPGAAPVPEDYGYLIELFGKPFGFRRNPEGEISWLNNFTTSMWYFNAPLSTIFSQFAAALAGHTDDRIIPMLLAASVDREMNQAKWLDRIFDQCIDAGTVTRSAPVNAKVPLRTNAAKCFTVKQDGTGNSAVTITAIHNDKTLLDQLRIGMLDGTLVSAPVIDGAKKNAPPPHYAEWTFPLFGPYKKTFIVTNMADAPASTRSFEPEFEFAIGNWNSSLTNIPAKVKPPVPAPGPMKPPPTKRTKLKEDLEQSIEDPINNLRPIIKSVRNDFESGSCSQSDILNETCGLRLSLILAPFLISESLLAADPVMGEVYTELFLSAPGGGAAATARLMSTGVKMEGELEQMEASKIRITMPVIDYGFTGTLKNAAIRVSKPGDGDYLSYSCCTANRSDFPTGKVTIEAYTPTLLRGSFSADLVDTDKPGDGDVPVIAKSITGSFLAPSLWKWDENIGIDTEHAEQEMIENMLQQMPMGSEYVRDLMGSMDSAPEELCGKLSAQQLQAMNLVDACTGQAQGGDMAQCSCECEHEEQESQIPACEKTCRVSWKQNCKEAVPDDREAQAAWCQRNMTSKGVPPEMQELLIGEFMKNAGQMPESYYKDSLRSLCGE